MYRASIITVVRIPYINRYEGATDLPCTFRHPKIFSSFLQHVLINLTVWVSHIMLCSNVETGVGCIASSLPALRYFFRRDRRSGQNNGDNAPGIGWSFFTIGSPPWRKPVDSVLKLSSLRHSRADDNWERLEDGAASAEGNARLHSRNFSKDSTHKSSTTANKNTTAMPDLRDVGDLITVEQVSSKLS